jgi:XRE family transcriptional regulator, regulator of sulfur utilization
MTMIVRDLGSSLRRLREERGWSQEQLAGHAGLNRSYVGEVERGRAIASIVTVEKLAAALGVSVADLLCSLPARLQTTVGFAQVHSSGEGGA